MVVTADQREREDRVSYAIPARTLQVRLSELQKQDRPPKPPPEEPPPKEPPPPEVAPLIRALNALDQARIKMVLASDNPWAVQARLPQVLKGLDAVEAAVVDAPSSDYDTVLETQAAISQAKIAYRQVDGFPSLLHRLLEALDKVRSAALNERQ